MNSGRCIGSAPSRRLMHYSYEKAGLTLHDQPIPWNAEAVLVEALLRLPRRRQPAQGRLLISACRGNS